MTTNTNTNAIMNKYIDFNNIGYSPIKPHSSGSKVTRLLHANAKEYLRIITPVMLTWGASEILESGTENPTGKWSMSLQFPEDEYSDEQTDEFYDAMSRLEHKIKEDALENSLQWFGKQHKIIEVIDALANPILKVSKNKKHDGTDKKPTLSVKLPCYDGKWKPEIFDEDAETVLFSPSKNDNKGTPVDYLPKMARVACEIECGGIWISNGKYSVVWNLIQARVIRPKVREMGKCHMTLSAEEKAEVSAKPPLQDLECPGEDNQSSTNGNTACAVVDTDDEGDGDENKAVESESPHQDDPEPESVVVQEEPEPAIVSVKPKPRVRVAKPK